MMSEVLACMHAACHAVVVDVRARAHGYARVPRAGPLTRLKLLQERRLCGGKAFKITGRNYNPRIT
jgi:hypothetical protein